MSAGATAPMCGAERGCPGAALRVGKRVTIGRESGSRTSLTLPITWNMSCSDRWVGLCCRTSLSMAGRD